MGLDQDSGRNHGEKSENERDFINKIYKRVLRNWHQGRGTGSSDRSKRKRDTKDNAEICKEPRLIVILTIYIAHMHPSQLPLFCVKIISCTRKPKKMSQ